MYNRYIRGDVCVYESHIFPNPNLEILFHYDEMGKNFPFNIHWHRNPEFLLGIQGEGIVSLDEAEIPIKAGEIVIVNSQIHNIRSISDHVSYWCLILNAESFGTPDHLPTKTNDAQILLLYRSIIREFSQKAPHYEDTIKGYIASMLALLQRQYLTDGSQNHQSSKNSRFQIIKQTMDYIHENFEKSLSAETISSAIGYSKYYLSHLFKEETKKTIFEYVLFVRCRNARELILNANYSVAKAAYQSGFSNLSYFSKVYFRTFGVLPSADLKKQKQETENLPRI